MTTSPRGVHVSRRDHGGAPAVLLHVLLLMLVLGQVVFLASRHRIRWDLTSDHLWSLTDSTKKIVEGLDKQLLVQAFFSPKDKLPVTHREAREVLDNFLDELVQLGRGRVVLQRLDPNSDAAIAKLATRVGVKPLDLSEGTTTSMSLDRHWIDLRLRYGGSRQKVLGLGETLKSPQFAARLAASPQLAEAMITPAIKEVTTEGKRRFGYMEWPVALPGQKQGLGWNTLRSHQDIKRRYEFQNVKNEDAPLLPDDLDTLFLFRPNDLSDRQKYVLDQFLMKGGTVVIFADAVDYQIGPRRQFTKTPIGFDAKGSEKSFLEQLRHYGIDWKPKVLCDMFREAHRPRNLLQQPYEYLAPLQQTPYGPRFVWKAYPYFFHAVAYDWSLAADKIARDPKTGVVDEKAAEAYRKFLPGMPSDEFLFSTMKKLGRGPGFYWPTWVGLRRKAGGEPDLPPGVEGQVMLWSSPAVLVEDPPANLNPFGYGDPQKKNEHYQKFVSQLNGRLMAEPRQQAPLMAIVEGRFSSFFAGSERPKRPSEIAEEKAAEEKSADEAGADEAGKDAGEQGELVGPEPPPDTKAEETKVAAEPAMRTESEAKGRIVIVGDSNFIRDDFVSGAYAQQGGPYSVLGGVFWSNLLDWLAEDSDLVALQSRTPTDRTLQLVDEMAPGTDPRVAEQKLAAKTTLLRIVNILLPVLLLAAFGMIVFVVRRAQKRSFLESVS